MRRALGVAGPGILAWVSLVSGAMGRQVAASHNCREGANSHRTRVHRPGPELVRPPGGVLLLQPGRNMVYQVADKPAQGAHAPALLPGVC